MKRIACAILAALLPGASLAAVRDENSAALKPLAKGATQRAGYYMPQRLMLAAAKPAGISREPTYSHTPLYGTLKFGPAESKGIVLALDEAPDASEARLYADSNADGDLTNDPAAVWNRTARKVVNQQTKQETEQVLFQGAIEVGARGEGASSVPLTIAVYRFAPETAKARNLPTDMLLYYRDYGREGTLNLGGKSYPIMLLDETASGRFDDVAHGEKEPPKVSLLIDRNGDGKFGQGERFSLAQPFNIGGTTYELDRVAPDGSSVSFKVSEKKVAEVPLPPDLSPGKAVLAFTRSTLEGKEIRFPESFKGKLVMLDFWATWCGPCLAEIPGLVKTYEKYRDKGLEILGISLDQANKADHVRNFVKEKNMPWPQVYDGKFWDAEIAQLYGIRAIPAAILVDGSTGKIVASGGDLRGENLDRTIARALEQLKAAK